MITWSAVELVAAVKFIEPLAEEEARDSSEMKQAPHLDSGWRLNSLNIQ